MKQRLWNYISGLRNTSPLVHSITNYVVMNNTANALLAAGASPIMAHAHPEMKDMVSIAGALVINIGTLDEYWVESMRLAIRQAETLKKPWILDPVGAGATHYRDTVLKELISIYHPSVIRANASEIMALAQVSTPTKGVDSVNKTEEAPEAARYLNKTTGAVICISGATDSIIHEGKCVSLKNGDPIMARITGMGCTATALTGAFCAANPANLFEATVAAMALMGVAGEKAAALAKGPGSLQMHFLDVLATITEQEFNELLILEEENAGI
ncbi:hydroxyethylthiazole kinase [Pedobacter hartonius]|uniref:Hydroxyethylthiazole kinase n=1 Tax=Pedobacter hartonius TaxID=425514 RepID=A0A1H4BIM1_9SPHI|nr:hydroxyethylthiazole kinase [Pedobacter hartonius]SEA47642.1 hydroxyethylthiazole kinase [Pedobacter hartonius]